MLLILNSLLFPLLNFPTATDSINYSDDLGSNVTLPRSFSDSSSFNDAATENVILPRTGTDIFSISEIPTRLLSLVRSFSDTSGFSDIAVKNTIFSRSTSDTSSFSDSVNWLFISMRTATDSVSFSDSAVRLISLLRNSSDSATLSDAATRLFIGSRSAVDSVSASDAASRIVSLIRALTDASTLSDTAAGTGSGGLPHTANDSVSFSELASVYTVGTWARQLPSDLLLDFTGNAAAGNIGYLAQPVLDGLAQTILTLLRNQGQIGSTYVFATQKSTFTTDFTLRIQLLMTNNPQFAALMRRNGYNP